MLAKSCLIAKIETCIKIKLISVHLSILNQQSKGEHNGKTYQQNIQLQQIRRIFGQISVFFLRGFGHRGLRLVPMAHCNHPYLGLPIMVTHMYLTTWSFGDLHHQFWPLFRYYQRCRRSKYCCMFVFATYMFFGQTGLLEYHKLDCWQESHQVPM